MTTILVTGATGFIGRHLIDRLLADHAADAIVCLVLPPRTAAERVALDLLRERGVRVIEGDLNDPVVSLTAAPQADRVFHLAANIDTAAGEPELRVNDVGCRNLLWWLSRTLPGARLIYSSSIAVLDRNGPASGPLNETSPCVPRTAYGRSKLRGEHLIQAEAARLGFDYTILRLATVYGRGAKAGGLFHRLMTDTRARKVLSRLNWPGRTSIVHVDDVTDIMLSLAKRPEAANQIYCVANAEAPTIGELARNIADLVPESAEPVTLPRWAWRMTRMLAWTRSAQLFGLILAQTAFWRFTLLIDDGFWLDTEKLQSVWTQAPKDLVEGLAEMLKYL